MPLPVDDVGTRRVEVAGGHQRTLDGILHLLDFHCRAAGQLQPHRLGQSLCDRCIEFTRGRAGRRNGALDLGQLERRQAAITLAQRDRLVHLCLSGHPRLHNHM